MPHRYQPLDVALSTVADAVIATDAQEKIIYLNPSAEKLTGWRAIDALGKPFADVFQPADPDVGGAFTRPLVHMTEPGAANPPTSASFMDRAGRRADIEYSAVALRDERSSLIGAVVVCRRRQPAAVIGAAAGGGRPDDAARPDAFHEEKERSYVTLNAMGDAVVSTNFNGQVDYLNEAAVRLTGWTQTDARGLKIDEVFVLVDRSTGQPIGSPATLAIIENRAVARGAACLLRRRDGSEAALEVSAAPMHDKNGGVIGAVMVAHELSAAPAKSDQPGRSASNDRLRGLPGRSLFGGLLAKAIADARIKGRYAALLHVGLDRFKSIRASIGNAAAEGLLEAVARRLVRCVRTSDTVGRQGDDVFVVLLTDLPHVNDAAVCAEKILDSLQSPYRITDDVLRLSANVGIALYPIDADQGDALLRCADFAMYQARYDGRNNYRLFSPRAPGDPSA